MNHKVELRFFEDDVTGEWGLSHKDTFNSETPFNAFWSGITIFHDVFEHWHEYKHKYFTGKYAMNVGGEMAAMGAMMYFVEQMDMEEVRRINKHNWYPHSKMAIELTVSEIKESIGSGYTGYGDTLESNVPYQPRTSSEMEYEIEDQWKEIKGMRYNSPRTQGDIYDDERAASKKYRKSVSLSKIQRLHRWGYHEASRRFPRNGHNINVLHEFIEFWDRFTKQNEAEEMAGWFKGITFRVYKKEKKIKWIARFNGLGNIKDYIISSDKLPRYTPSWEEMVNDQEYVY